MVGRMPGRRQQESGHKNVGDCMRIFDDLKKRLDNIGMNFLGDFTVEQKETWPPLMAADLLAAQLIQWCVRVIWQGRFRPVL
jgi:hypothetical protein